MSQRAKKISEQPPIKKRLRSLPKWALQYIDHMDGIDKTNISFLSQPLNADWNKCRRCGTCLTARERLYQYFNQWVCRKCFDSLSTRREVLRIVLVVALILCLFKIVNDLF